VFKAIRRPQFYAAKHGSASFLILESILLARARGIPSKLCSKMNIN
jgi:hypothetical protein